MSVQALRRKLATLEQRATTARPDRRSSVLDDPRRDPRLWDTALGILNGTLQPGAFAPGLPEALQAESIARVRDLAECARYTGQFDAPEVQPVLAWLAAVDGSGEGTP